MRPTRIEARDPAANPVQRLEYQYDAADNILERLGLTSAQQFSYDALDRLTGVAGTPEQNAFTYDPVGNRLQEAAFADEDGVPHGWEYDASDRLIRRGTVQYEYDANGSLVREHDTQTGVVRQFSYDHDQRLIAIRTGTGALIARYGYDPFGRRVSKTVGGATTFYLYAEEGLVAEVSTTGTVTTTYGYEPDTLWGTRPLFIRQGAQFGYYQRDHLGTPKLITSASGAVLWQADYDAFGRAHIHKAEITNPLRFPGQYYDAESGLHYNWHRYYEPGTGRYVSSDPIGLYDGVNLYIYANNNPIMFYDPYGLWRMWRLGDPLPQGFVDASAGFGDGVLNAITVGFWDGDYVREKLGSGGVVDPCSGEYSAGNLLGSAGGSVIGVGGAARSGYQVYKARKKAMAWRSNSRTSRKTRQRKINDAGKYRSAISGAVFSLVGSEGVSAWRDVIDHLSEESTSDNCACR